MKKGTRILNALLLCILAFTNNIQPNVAQDLQTIIDISNKFKIDQNDAELFFEALNKINDDQLENTQLEDLNTSLIKVRYAKVFEDFYNNNKTDENSSKWEGTTTDKNGNEVKIGKLVELDTKIAQLPVEKTFAPGLEGEKNKLDFSLNKYQYLDDQARINQLVKSGEIYSIQDIFGTTQDGSDGIIYGLIKKRLDDNETEFKNQKSSNLEATQLEDPINSWNSIRSLISRTRTIFLDKVEDKELDKAGIWQKLINSPITHKERAESIKRIVSRELLNGKTEDFKKRVVRFLISLDNSVSQEIRSNVASDVLSYQTINKTGEDLKDLLAALRQQVSASEIFTNGETVAFELYGNDKKTFLATDASDTLVAKNVNAAETTAHFVVEIKDGKVMLTQGKGEDKKYVNSYSCKLEPENTNTEESQYQFFVHGSRSGLTLQSAYSIGEAVGGGTITIGANNSVKTQSESLAIIRFTQDNQVEQTPWNTFEVISVTTAINLLGQYKTELNTSLASTSSTELAAAIKNYSQILSLFLSPTQNPEIYIDEIIYILQQAENNNNHAKLKNQKDLITNLVNSCVDAFAPLANQNENLGKKLSDLKYKLEVNLSTDFVSEAVVGSPENSEVITLSVDSKYLIVRKDPILGGKFKYTLEAAGDSPSDSKSHLEVASYKSIVGLKSTFAQNLFLSWVEESGTLEFKQLKKDSETNFDIPLEAESNSDAQFIFENGETTGLFYIKNVASGKYLNNNSGAITLSDTKTEFSFIVINDFYRELGLIASETNIFVKLERYLNLINFALTDEDRNFILLDLEKIIIEKKQDLQTWNNFLSNQEAIEIISQIFLELEKATTDKTIYDRVVNLFQDSFAVNLNDFVGKKINISWRDSNGEYFYLSSLDSSDEELHFKSNNSINPKAVLELEIDNNGDLKIKKTNSDSNETQYVTFDSSTDILKLMSSSSSTSTYNQNFTYQGDISLIALQPKMNNTDLKAGYFIAVKPDRTTSFSPGINKNGDFLPFGYKQQFSINVYSELEKKLIEAKEKFNLDSPKDAWNSLSDSDPENDKAALSDLKSNDTKANLVQRLDVYDQLLNEIVLDRNKYSFEDKLVLFKELENFVLNLTTKLGGTVYIELLANPDIYDLFDQTILNKAAQISSQDAALKQTFERTVKSWDEGYLGTLNYNNGNLVALKIGDKYLRAVEETYQGMKFIQLKADLSNTMSPQAHFRLYVYKNKIGIKSEFFKNRFLTSPTQIIKTDSRVLNRLNMEIFDINKTEFGAAGSENIQFELNGNMLQSFILGNEGKVSSDGDDEYFVRLNELTSTSASTTFSIEKLDPIHEKLSQIKQSEDLVEKMLIFMEVLDEKYVTKSNKADFLLILKEFTKSLKSDPAIWKEFSASQENFDNMEIIFSLMEEQKEGEILTESEIIEIKNAFAGYVKTPLEDILNQKVVISWTDVDGQIYYMQDDSNILNFNSQDKLDPKNSLNINLDSTNDNPLTITINNITAYSKLTALGGFTNLAFKTASKDFLNVKRTETAGSIDRTISYSAGVKDLSNILRPLPNLQVFSLQVLSDLENALVEARNQTTSGRLDSYIFIAENLANKNSKKDTEVFFEEIEKFILTTTQDLTLYNAIKDDSSLDFAVTSILAALSDLSKNDKDLEIRTLEIIQSWEEGFVDSAPDSAPENNEIVVLKIITTTTTNNETTDDETFVKIEEEIYQGQIYHTLKSVGKDGFDTLDSSNHFKVLQYKGKFGFESQAFKNKILTWIDDATQNSNLVLLEKSKNEKDSYISFGLPGTENSQFTLEALEGDDSKFKIKNLKAGKYINLNGEQVELSADEVKLEFYKLAPLDKKLMLARSATDDKSRLTHYLEAITQNYVLNAEEGKILINQIEIFLEKKKENREIWDKFKSNLELAKILEEIIQEMDNHVYLNNSNLQSSFDSGFKEQIPDDKTIQLLWNAQDGTKRNLIMVSQTVASENSEGVTTYKLALAPSDYVLRSNGLFNIEYKDQTNKELGVYLTFTNNDEKYYLKSDDAIASVINTSFKKADADSEPDATLFDYSGSLKNLSLKSSTTDQGFLTISKIGKTFGGSNYQLAATMSEIGDKIEPAGKEINGRLLPTAYETFELSVVSQTQQELIYIASLMESESPTVQDMADSIASYIEYPTYYQAANNEVLSLNPEDKNAFLSNINNFVQIIVSDQTRAKTANANEEVKQLFSQLVAIISQMQWNEEEKNLIGQMSFAWERGYLGEVSTKAPADESIFAILQGEINITKTLEPNAENEQEKENNVSNDGFGNSIGKDSSTTKTPADDQTQSNEQPDATGKAKLISQLKVAVARANDDLEGIYCLSLAPKNSDFVALGDELEYEKFLLENDPFDKAAQFQAMVSGDVFGLKSIMLEGMALASEDEFAKFVEETFYQDFGANNQHFKFDSDTLKDFADLYLTADSNTQFFKTSNKANQKFTFLELSSPVYQNLLQIRTLSDNKEKLELYNQSVELVKTETELQLLFDDLVRFLARYKQKREYWNQIINASIFIEYYVSAMQNLKKKFGSDDSKLKMNSKYISMIDKYVNYLTGVMYPEFAQEVQIDETIISFEEQFNVLKNRIKSIDKNSIDKFMQDLEELYLRRVELDFDNQNSKPSKNLEFTANVFKWLELEAAYSRGILNLDMSETMLEYAEKFKSEVKYQDIINFLEYNLENHQAFSEDRFFNFCYVASKLTSKFNLMKAAAEEIDLKRVEVILKRTMANQGNWFMEQTLYSYNEMDELKIQEKIDDDETFRTMFISWIEELTEPEIYKGKFYLDKIEDLANDLESNWDEIVNTLNYWEFALTKYSQEDKKELGMAHLDEEEFNKNYKQQVIKMLVEKITAIIAHNDESQTLDEDKINQLQIILNQIADKTGITFEGEISSTQMTGSREVVNSPPSTDTSNTISTEFDVGRVQARPTL